MINWKNSLLFFSILSICPFICSYQSDPGISYAASRPCLGQDAKGNRIAIWAAQHKDGILIQSSTFLDGQGWSRPITLSAIEREVISSPSLAINNHGQVVVVWESYNKHTEVNCIELSTYTFGDHWSQPFILSESTETVRIKDHQVSLDDSGNILVLWSAYDAASPDQCQIRSIAGSFEGSWGETVTISN